MDYKLRLTAALPKEDDLNGWADPPLAERLCKPHSEHRHVSPQVALIVYGVRTVEIGKAGIDTGVLELLSVQPVLTPVGRALAETMLADEHNAQTLGVMPSHALKTLWEETFADLPRSTSEIDQRELLEMDAMSPTDVLRKHLERVHGRNDAATLTALEAEHRHDADHLGDMPIALGHAPDWFGWTRADIEAATAETDGEDPDRDDLLDVVTQEYSVADPEGTHPEDDGTPTNDEIEGVDPDYGKDLDDDDDRERDGRYASGYNA